MSPSVVSRRTVLAALTAAMVPAAFDPLPAPAATSYGVPPNLTLTDYNPPSTTGVVTLPDGFVGDRLRIHGVVVPLGRARVTRSILRGPSAPLSGNQALVRCYNRRSGQAVFDQCLFRPQVPFNSLDGLLGWQYEVYRSEISDTVDGLGIYATSATGSSAARVHVEDVWVHRLVYRYPDLVTPSHVDGTHNDCVQIQGGSDITLRRLRLEATASTQYSTPSNPAKPWLAAQQMANGAALIISNNTGIRVASTLVDSCTFMGGLAEWNIKPGVAFTARYNRFYRRVAQLAGTYAGYWIRFDDMRTNAISGIQTCTWVDGPYAGQVLTRPRDRGIQDNANP
jgi:hypothetical protein